MFVHGFGGDRLSWDLIWDALLEGHRYLRYDLRDFGQSSVSDDGAFSHTEDLLDLLDALSIDRCNLVGLSMGGSIAINFTLDHPHRVEKLALLSPGLTAWEWSDEWRGHWRAIAAAARSGDIEAARRLWWSHPLFDGVRDTPIASLALAEIDRFSGEQWFADRQRSALPDVERLHLLSTPTLLLTGKRDCADFRLIADVIAGSAEHVVRKDRAGVGHLLNLEAPIWCATELAAFWGQTAD